MRTALTRQISEAVRIGQLGDDVVLNRKAEHNRCKIGRLTIGDENKAEHNIENVIEEEQRTEEGDKEIQTWERTKINSKRTEELRGRVDLGSRD